MASVRVRAGKITDVGRACGLRMKTRMLGVIHWESQDNPWYFWYLTVNLVTSIVEAEVGIQSHQ